jgi:hypothetical protein
MGIGKKGNRRGKGFQKKLLFKKNAFLDFSNQENWSGKGFPPVTLPSQRGGRVQQLFKLVCSSTHLSFLMG